MVDFGSAWSCLEDLTMPAIMVTGFRVIAENIACRWGTARGGLPEDPNFGYRLADFINDDIDRVTLAQIQRAAEAEAEKDQRVDSCEVSLSLVNGAMIVVGKVTTQQGPFSLVVSASAVSTTLLQVSQ